ncbi:MAG: hypothetical protein ACLFR1_02470 [Spirochaetia bacterium]
MKIRKIAETLEYEIVQNDFEDDDITEGYTSDLLSDVMAHAPADSAFITIQAHKNAVAVSSLAGVLAIIICNSRPIPDDMTAAAAEEGIAILRTSEDQFTASYKLARALGK